MRADIAALRDAVPAFGVVASTLDLTLRRLVSALDAEGACWGTDEMGATFGDSYRPTAAAVREAMATLSASIDEIGRAVGTVADSVDAAEARAQARLG
jgi:uncharacterized protein YukE